MAILYVGIDLAKNVLYRERESERTPKAVRSNGRLWITAELVGRLRIFMWLGM